MTGPLLTHEAILFLAVVGGAIAGLLGYKLLKSRNEIGRLGDTIAFVGGAFGILLGLLLLFAVEHYNKADDASRNEAIASVALFNGLSPYPTEQRDQARHDLVCLMRSSATDDWRAVEGADLTGSEVTATWARIVQKDIEQLPLETTAQVSNHYFVTQEVLERSKFRQQRLLFALPMVPVAIWIVVYLCSFIFTALLVFHIADKRWLAGLAVLSVYVVLMASVGTLVLLDYPFAGVGATVNPIALEGSLVRLESQHPAKIFLPCGTPVAPAEDGPQTPAPVAGDPATALPAPVPS